MRTLAAPGTVTLEHHPATPMAHVLVSKDTKKQLLHAAANQEGIEPWMFSFISHDPDFQAQLFRAAEEVKNWRFLASLTAFRAAQQEEAKLTRQPPPTRRKSTRVRQRTYAAPPRRTGPSRRQLRRHRQRTTSQPTFGPPINPASLPAGLVLRVRPEDFTNCPRCKLRLLKFVLQDHLDLSCPFRGRVEGGTLAPGPKSKRGSSGIVFCPCGKRAAIGDTVCYDHKHT